MALECSAEFVATMATNMGIRLADPAANHPNIRCPLVACRSTLAVLVIDQSGG